MLFGALRAGTVLLRGRRWRVPYLTICICALLSCGFILQYIFPHLLPLFERNAGEIRHGQWWRVLSALFFQDGWFAGATFNLVMLLLVGGVAEQVLTRNQWAAIYFAGGMISEIIALFWQPIGAGNSIATCALAGCVVAMFPGRKCWSMGAIARLVALAAAIGLALRRDIHGVSFLVGALLGVAILGSWGKKHGAPPQSE